MENISRVTSSMAFREVKEEGIIKANQILIMQALYVLKRGIRSEIAAQCKLSEDAVWRRLSELERKGLIEKTGRIFISGTTGRKQCEWQLVGTPKEEGGVR